MTLFDSNFHQVCKERFKNDEIVLNSISKKVVEICNNTCIYVSNLLRIRSLMLVQLLLLLVLCRNAIGESGDELLRKYIITTVNTHCSS